MTVILRLCDALTWVAVYVREAAERAEVILSDRRNAIAIKALASDRSTECIDGPCNPECLPYSRAADSGSTEAVQ